MGEKLGVAGGVAFMGLYMVGLPLGWLYHIWAMYTLQEFGWMIAGIIVAPFGSIVGLWSLLFGVPGFMH